MKATFWTILAGWLLMSGCSQPSSRAEIQNQHGNKRDERVLISRQQNEKYGLSVLFYQDTAHKSTEMTLIHDLPNTMVFRDDKTNKELQTVELPGDGYFFSDVWSPDGEYLLLHCENYYKLCIYKASELLSRLEQQKTFDLESADDFVGNIVYTEMNLPNKGRKHKCPVAFMYWDGKNGVVFKASSGGKGAISVFKYNIEQQKIYSSATRLNNKLGSEYGFEAANKNGKLEFARENE